MATSLLLWVLTYAIHSTVLLGGVWLVTRIGSLSLTTRELLWKTALVGGFATTSLHLGLGMPAPWNDLALPPALVRSVAEAEPTPVLVREVRTRVVRHDTGDVRITAVRTPRDPQAFAQVHTDPAPRVAWPWVLLGIVGFGSVFALARLSWQGHRLARKLADRRDVIEDPLLETFLVLCDEAGIRNKRKMRLRASARLRSPVALWRHEIVVPERAIDGLTPAQQRGMLAHELAHLLRGDPLWSLAAAVIEAACFFQPLNHLARREIQEIAEFLCDDWAARKTGSGIDLAKCLAEVASWQGGDAPVHIVAMAADRSPIVRRITRLLQRSPVHGEGDRGFALRWAAAVGLIGLVTWLVPGVRPAAATTAPLAVEYELDAEDGIMVVDLGDEGGRPRSRVRMQTAHETLSVEIERPALMPPPPPRVPPVERFRERGLGWSFELWISHDDVFASAHAELEAEREQVRVRHLAKRARERALREVGRGRAREPACDQAFEI